MMRIGEVAQRAGVSPDTIRFYEKLGLLDASLYQRHTNNYRIYTEAAVERLTLIKHAKRFGFTLAELRQLSDQWQSDQLSGHDKIEILAAKLDEIDQHMRELAQLKAYVAEKLASLRETTEQTGT